MRRRWRRQRGGASGAAGLTSWEKNGEEKKNFASALAFWQLERSADAYPWSYDDGEERYESGEELDDDEREGEMRLREVWDDEVEREEEEGAGERQDSRTVEESDEEDGDSDLGNEIDNEDVVESILGERGIGDRVEVKVRWVEGGEETWEPVEAVRDCEGYGRYLRERDRDRRWSMRDAGR